MIPRFVGISHEANVDVIKGNASFRARLSIDWTVLDATGMRNITRRDSTKQFRILGFFKK